MRKYTVQGETVQVGTAAVVVHVERKLAPKGGPRVLSVGFVKTNHGLRFAAVWTVTAWNNVQQIRRARVNGELFDALVAEAQELADEAEYLDAMAEGAAIAADPAPEPAAYALTVTEGDDFPY